MSVGGRRAAKLHEKPPEMPALRGEGYCQAGWLRASKDEAKPLYHLVGANRVFAHSPVYTKRSSPS